MVAWPFVILGLWVFFAFVLPPLVLPYMRKRPLPTRFPRQLEQACEQLSSQHDRPYDYLQHAVVYLLSQNHADRLRGIFEFHKAFETDVRSLLERRGFMHAHHLSHLMRIMLSKSPFASDADIRIRYTFLNFRIHHYLQVRVAGQWYDVDVSGYWWGVPLGSHAWGFR